MTEQRLQTHIGFFVIFSNVFILISAIALYFFGGFLFDELTTILAVIIPMFSVYTTAIIKHFLKERSTLSDNSKLVNFPFVLISWLFPVLFVLYVILILLLKASNIGFENFEQFKTLLIASETVFGVYFGLVLRSMFEIEQSSAAPGAQ